MFRNMGRVSRLRRTQVRYSSDDGSCGEQDPRKGLVLGVYQGCNPGEYFLSPSATGFDSTVGGRVSDIVKRLGVQQGEVHVLHNLGPEYYAVAVVGAGPQAEGYNDLETLNVCKENIRVAAGSGARALQDQGLTKVDVEGFTNDEAAAEGAHLGVWNYEMYRSNPDLPVTKVSSYRSVDKAGWERGELKAKAQNTARVLEETPANLMTPEKLADAAIRTLCPCGVEVVVRDREWIETQQMWPFLQMARSSCTPPLLIEMSYCGGSSDQKPIVLAGKGITFDSGGLCLRPCKNLADHKAEMAGAAVTIGVMLAVATLGLPYNVNGLIPTCENMPGGQATKPGDVAISRSGRSMRVVDTSREARVILSDILSFAIKYNPCIVGSIANATRSIVGALGASSSAAFVSSQLLWNTLEAAGGDTGDRVWRMPLWRYFGDKISNLGPTDLENGSRVPGGEPCNAAAFLFQFVPAVDFLHLDITGTGMVNRDGKAYPYLREGLMTGRPTRTVTQLIAAMACPNDSVSVC